MPPLVAVYSFNCDAICDASTEMAYSPGNLESRAWPRLEFNPLILFMYALGGRCDAKCDALFPARQDYDSAESIMLWRSPAHSCALLRRHGAPGIGDASGVRAKPPPGVQRTKPRVPNERESGSGNGTGGQPPRRVSARDAERRKQGVVRECGGHAGQAERAESEASGGARDTRPKGRDRAAGSAG